jgi:hypothetical protein
MNEESFRRHHLATPDSPFSRGPHGPPRLAIAAVFALSLPAGAARARRPIKHVDRYGRKMYAIAADSVYVGGSFGSVGPNTGHFVGIDAGTGLPKPGWPQVNGTIYCSTADGAGGWYIRESFTSVGGVAGTGSPTSART